MKKIISILLSVCVLLSLTAGVSFTAKATDYQGIKTQASNLTTGDTFQMGIYPQSEVTDSTTKTALANISCTMKSYGYWKNSSSSNHTYEIVNMSYADISYNGNVYRKVRINEYRPFWTDSSSSYSNTFQYDNGYTTGNTYYFKWEPIVWYVLAKESEGIYVMSKTLLDSQAYNNYAEATTWETCSLRAWLNNDFYNSAFSNEEKAKINTITHQNEDNPNKGANGGNVTTDKLWLLSFSDTINRNYGFSTSASAYDMARRAQGSAYAKSQGLYVITSNDYQGNSYWWLRTPGYDPDTATGVIYDGCTIDDGNDVILTEFGIRPAFKLNLNSEIYKLDEKYSYCNHKAVVDKYVPATFTSTGKTQGSHCSVCGQVLTKQNDIAKLVSPALTKLKKGKKSFTAQWSKANGVDGYQVQYSLKKNFKKAKTKYSKGTKLTVKKLKSKKTYYVRVRAYKKIGGKNVYSAWSTKKVKVK